MKVLHTSDWHLGRSFHGASLLAEQRRALGRVVEIAGDEGVDVVVISGDLYDRAIPPADAVDLLAEALTDLRSTGAVIVAITGNHDSPNRVGALDPLLRAGGVTLRGRFDPTAPIVVPSTDGGPDLVVHPIPYLEPLAAGPVPVGDAGDEGGGRRRRPTQHDVLGQAMRAVRTDLAARGRVRSVVVAHAFVAGAAPSDSERELSVGGVDRVPASAFDGIDYTALGHLHRPQELGPALAYSGSLLPYSFSETGPSSVRVVDIDPVGVARSTTVPLGCERPVVTLDGRLADLLTDPAHQPAERAWVRARLTDEVLPAHAMERLRERFAYAVVLEHVVPRSSTAAPDIRQAGESVSDLELALAFVEGAFGRPADESEVLVLRQAFDRVEAGRREQTLVTEATAEGDVDVDLTPGAVA